jgi:hypothetical protein
MTFEEIVGYRVEHVTDSIVAGSPLENLLAHGQGDMDSTKGLQGIAMTGEHRVLTVKI